MFKIIKKEELEKGVKLLEISAEKIAKNAHAGQFFMLRIDEKGERIPLTIADRSNKTITAVFLEIGETTKRLGQLKKGDKILDVVGPLGNGSDIKKYGTVVCVGGGLGIPAIYPIAKELRKAGNKIICIIGARNKELLFWEDKINEVSDKVYITTDNGSCGEKGVVTDPLKKLMEEEKIDKIIAVGPPIMMKFVALTTKEKNIPTFVSLNPIMVDGMGMCGGCRVDIGGEIKFACVDGPEFDAHKVNWDYFLNRMNMYKKEEECKRKCYKK